MVNGGTPSPRNGSQDSISEAHFALLHRNIEHVFTIPSEYLDPLNYERDVFLASLVRETTGEDPASPESEPQSDVGLVVSFIQFLLDNQAPRLAVRALIQAFQGTFLSKTDIHALVANLPDDVEAQKRIIRTYYLALSTCYLPANFGESALFTAAAEGRARIYTAFGGQGAVNPLCLKVLKDLFFLYQPFLQPLIEATAPVIEQLSRSPRTRGFYQGRQLTLQKWLEDPESAPSDDFLATTAVSLPLIGLISLSHYCITCRILDKTPGELRSRLSGVTGHSQGLIIAACVAQSESWDSFIQNAKLAVEILFWLGYESNNGAPRSPISSALIKDSLENNEGRPSCMLSVRGLKRYEIESVIANCNKGLDHDENVYLALVNARDNFMVSGPARSLIGLNRHLRKIKASDDLDQSRVPFNQRKPNIVHTFLPISAPFHSPYLEDAANIIKHALSSKSIDVQELKIPVINTMNGTDLRDSGNSNVINTMVDAICTDMVDWPTTLNFKNATHLIAYGGAAIDRMCARVKEGQGVRVISGYSLERPTQSAGTKAELFAPCFTKLSIGCKSWAEEFSPRLLKSPSGEVKLDTRLSRFLECPPVITAGMTPTTIHWEFVRDIMNAGYHAELAGGGYFMPSMMSDAIEKLIDGVAPGKGVSCNVIYVNPAQIGWQIPMLQKLVRQGMPIDGLTIGAGVPSAEIAAEYIETLSLKHISFKPGSHSAIRETIAIANAHPSTAVILQWTGGRGGGHHSFEDVHAPILDLYARIRECPNIALVAGSGFGDAEDSYPYLTGAWAMVLGYPAMPFDGILMGSRMMVAKEAFTSPESKQLITKAEGTSDEDWAHSYNRPAGGILTVQSEMGQPIHKVATRGVKFWAEMDRRFFSLPKAKKLPEMLKNKNYIISKLNADFSKPWFGVSPAGRPCEVVEMTYAGVLARLIELMYVAHQKRWIDVTYKKLVQDVVVRTMERLSADDSMPSSALDRAENFHEEFAKICPHAATQLLHPEDAAWFINRCKFKLQKPMNFIPTMDEEFEFNFKKDSLWQSEDVQAVLDQDADRTCILQGPVATRYSKKADQSAKEILDGITLGHISMIKRDYYSETKIPVEQRSVLSLAAAEKLKGVAAKKSSSGYVFAAASKDTYHLDEWRSFLVDNTSDWMHAVLTEDFVLHGKVRKSNPLRSMFDLRQGEQLFIDQEKELIFLSRGEGQTAQTLVKASCLTPTRVVVDIYFPFYGISGPPHLALTFSYDRSRKPYSLAEIIEGRNCKIRNFYKQVWAGGQAGSDESPDTYFQGKKLTITPQMARDMITTVGLSYFDSEMADHDADVLPIDSCIVIAWDVLVRPLLLKEIDGDLLALVHLSNSFQYYAGATPLRIGDIVQSKSHVSAITISDAGKTVEVRASIERDGKPVVLITSAFLLKGSFDDFGSTFKYNQEPEMELEIKNRQDEMLLKNREWFHLHDPSLSLVEKHLHFRLRTRTTWESQKVLDSLETRGVIYWKHGSGKLEEIGVVHFEAGRCMGNPVTNFLERKGGEKLGQKDLKNAGWPGDCEMDVVIPQNNDIYGRISRDFNPIHVSPVFASIANLPGTITHGMYTSAVARGVLEHMAADGDSARFHRYSASFTGMVLPGDKLTVKFEHKAMVQGRMVVKLHVLKKSSGEPVLEGEAEIEQPTTAYAFTGQGSQAKDMGMALYQSSAVARKVWDDVDQKLQQRFGWSILEIVRSNPKRLTVYFGGKRGRELRANYLAMRIDVARPDGTVVSEPILRDLTPKSRSYTFQEPRGLIFSTQFAQPAITILEKASYEDMRSKGLIQEGAAFAGHSLGEYGVLSAFAEFMPFETMMSVVFYRGLAMQVAIDRDEHGRSDFSMVAVNPGRVGKCKSSVHLRPSCGRALTSLQSFPRRRCGECQVLSPKQATACSKL